ncbi:MAG TPA: hypothetical protein VEY95_11465 [Azospirillaceae bacterium]|nr:hypothetical protein [Azospirillaceae bacterium]
MDAQTRTADTRVDGPNLLAPEMSPEAFAQSPMMRWVKVAMVVMGLAIIAGFVFIGVEVYRRATDPEYRSQAGGIFKNRAAEPAPAARPAAGAATGAVASAAAVPVIETATVTASTGGFRLPAGSRILEQTAIGSRLAVLVELAGGGQTIYVLSPQGRNELQVQEVLTAPAR